MSRSEQVEAGFELFRGLKITQIESGPLFPGFIELTGPATMLEADFCDKWDPDENSVLGRIAEKYGLIGKTDEGEKAVWVRSNGSGFRLIEGRKSNQSSSRGSQDF